MPSDFETTNAVSAIPAARSRSRTETVCPNRQEARNSAATQAAAVCVLTLCALI